VGLQTAVLVTSTNKDEFLLLCELLCYCCCQWKVRRTLAFSIHHLAVILGEELTCTDLVPVFDELLKDLDEVRIGLLKHLVDFLQVSYTVLQLLCLSTVYTTHLYTDYQLKCLKYNHCN